MKSLSKSLKPLLAVGLLVASSWSYAIPTLTFSGSTTYSPDLDPAELNVMGVLTSGFQDLSTTPDLTTSTVMLSADFLSASSDGGLTTGLFGSTPANDLQISDSYGFNSLLTGDVSSLTFTAFETGAVGILEGTISITGGSLADDFGGLGSLFAINVSLDPSIGGLLVFGPDAFDSSFFAVTNGSIEAAQVPEPLPLALLSIGLVGLVLTRRNPQASIS